MWKPILASCLYILLTFCNISDQYPTQFHNSTHHHTIYGNEVEGVHSHATLKKAHAITKIGGLAHALVGSDHAMSHAITKDGKHGSITFTHKVNGIVYTFTHRWKRYLNRIMQFWSGRTGANESGVDLKPK